MEVGRQGEGYPHVTVDILHDHIHQHLRMRDETLAIRSSGPGGRTTDGDALAAGSLGSPVVLALDDLGPEGVRAALRGALRVHAAGAPLRRCEEVQGSERLCGRSPSLPACVLVSRARMRASACAC